MSNYVLFGSRVIRRGVSQIAKSIHGTTKGATGSQESSMLVLSMCYQLSPSTYKKLVINSFRSFKVEKQATSSKHTKV